MRKLIKNHRRYAPSVVTVVILSTVGIVAWPAIYLELVEQYKLAAYKPVAATVISVNPEGTKPYETAFAYTVDGYFYLSDRLWPHGRPTDVNEAGQHYLAKKSQHRMIGKQITVQYNPFDHSDSFSTSNYNRQPRFWLFVLPLAMLAFHAIGGALSVRKRTRAERQRVWFRLSVAYHALGLLAYLHSGFLIPVFMYEAWWFLIMLLTGAIAQLRLRPRIV